MHLNELGFDYSNLVSCTIRRKSYVLTFVAFIIASTLLFIALTFGILYLAEVPFHINGQYVQFGDPAYRSFFYGFLGIMGGLFILMIVLGILDMVSKPKVFMAVDNDENMNRFYYLYLRAKRQEIYLTDQFAIIYRANYNTAYLENNSNLINDLMDKYVFWKQFETLTDYKIIHGRKKTVLKFKESTGSRFVTLYKRFAFSEEINVVPIKVSESVNIRTGGNVRTQMMATYLFEDINRKPEYEIHPEIKKTLSQTL